MNFNHSDVNCPDNRRTLLRRLALLQARNRFLCPGQ